MSLFFKFPSPPLPSPPLVLKHSGQPSVIGGLLGSSRMGILPDASGLAAPSLASLSIYPVLFTEMLHLTPGVLLVTSAAKNPTDPGAVANLGFHVGHAPKTCP